MKRKAVLSLVADTCTVDVTRFWVGATDPASSLERLHAAIELYNGPLLEDLESALESSAPLYVEWLTETRAAVEGQLRTVLYRLAESCVRERRRFDLGIGACNRLLAEEPDREEVHRLKMRLLARDGQRAAALKQYDLCTAALLDELGVPPSDETNALYDRILAGEVGTAGADAESWVAGGSTKDASLPGRCTARSLRRPQAGSRNPGNLVDRSPTGDHRCRRWYGRRGQDCAGRTPCGLCCDLNSKMESCGRTSPPILRWTSCKVGPRRMMST